MRWLRGVLIGVLIWVLIFVEISITMIGLNLSDFWVWTIHYIALIPIVLVCSWLYYRSKDNANGFLLGLFFLFVGIVLDAAITVPLFKSGKYFVYFSNFDMLFGFVEFVILAGIYGWVRKKK